MCQLSDSTRLGTESLRCVGTEVGAMNSTLLRLGYALVALKGVFAALAPRATFGLITKTWSLGLKNVDELEPRAWYLTAIRTTGIGMLAAGLAGIVLSGADDSVTEDDHGPESVEPIDISPAEE